MGVVRQMKRKALLIEKKEQMDTLRAACDGDEVAQGLLRDAQRLLNSNSATEIALHMLNFAKKVGVDALLIEQKKYKQKLADKDVQIKYLNDKNGQLLEEAAVQIERSVKQNTHCAQGYDALWAAGALRSMAKNEWTPIA